MSDPGEYSDTSQPAKSPPGETHWAHSRSPDHQAAAGNGEPTVVGWTVVGVSVVIVAISLVLSIWYLIRPGERDDDHIKRRILRD